MTFSSHPATAMYEIECAKRQAKAAKLASQAQKAFARGDFEKASALQVKVQTEAWCAQDILVNLVGRFWERHNYVEMRVDL
jgi:hypothetical protein